MQLHIQMHRGKMLVLIAGHQAQTDNDSTVLRSVLSISKRLYPWMLSKKPALTVKSSQTLLVSRINETEITPADSDRIKQMMENTFSICKSVTWDIQQQITIKTLCELVAESSISQNPCNIVWFEISG